MSRFLDDTGAARLVQKVKSLLTPMESRISALEKKTQDLQTKLDKFTIDSTIEKIQFVPSNANDGRGGFRLIFANGTQDTWHHNVGYIQLVSHKLNGRIVDQKINVDSESIT